MLTRKKSLVALVILLLALVLVAAYACRRQPSSQDGKPTTQEQSAFDRIRDSKTIRAGYIVYPPTVIAGNNPAQPTGFLVDIVNEIAKQAELKVAYEETTFDDFKSGLLLGKYDLVVAGIFETVPRAKDLRFTRPIVYWAGVSAIAQTQDAGRFRTLEEINKKDVQLAVTAGTAEHEFVEKNVPNATIRALPNSDIALTLTEVTANRADVAFADAITIRNFISANPSVAQLFGGKELTTFATSFVVRPGDERLQAFLDSSIEALHLSGTIESLSRKYEGEKVWRLPTKPWE